MTKSINRLLREALEERAAAAAPTGCLDAETAAAFADDTLSAHERSGAEAHVADCARCQALLAALARTMPPAVTRAWWRRPAIAWLAPLTVAAAAAIVWVGIPRRAHVAPVAQSARAAAPSVETEASRPSPPAVVKEMRERYRTPSTNRAPETMRRDAPADKRSIAPSLP